MTVQDFLDLLVDPEAQKFEIWSNTKEETLFAGYLNDITDEDEERLLWAEISSIDNIWENNKGAITLNIDEEYEED